ncbi:MAG: hypothetical protein RBS57_13285 [Desulforhabdus sp.]|jgi:hypothetical protein|nr:hypothetical protein [Desulforhabdus sp.]
MQLFSQQAFFDKFPAKMFYVGFLKSTKSWFPLCIVSEAEGIEKLDTLLISPTLRVMDETVKSCAQQIAHVEETFVHYLTLEEIKNLVGRYALDHVAIMEAEVDHGDSCGCGCGCS